MAIVAGTYTHTSAAAGAGPFTMSYTATAPGGGEILFVAFAIVKTVSPTAVTYGGIAMTQVGTKAMVSSTNQVYLYRLYNAPAGAANVSISVSGSTSIEIGAIEYTDSTAVGNGIDQVNTFNSGASTTMSETLTPSVTNMWMITVTTGQGADATATTNCTLRSGVSAQRDLGLFDSNANVLTGGAAFTMTQTGGNTDDSMVSATFSIPPGISFGGIAGANVNASSGTSVAVSGNNTVGFVLIQGDVAADNITAVSWGGVAMTKVAAVKEPSDRWLSLWWVANPSSGGTIVATGGAFWNFYSFYYRGVHQTAPIDSSNTGTVTSTAALTVATTVVKTGCWYVVGTANANGVATYTSTGTLRLAAANGVGMGSIIDSNTAVATGSQSKTSTCSSAFTQGGIAVSLAPVTYINKPPLLVPQAINRAGTY